MIVRAARPEDAARIAAIYAPHVAAGIVTFETEAPDTSAMRARMAASDGLYPWIVLEEDGLVQGYACAFRFRERAAYRWAVETSIYVAPAAQGHGAGRRLYAALLGSLVAQGFTQAIGVIALPNPASIRLHEQAGFHRAGVFPDLGCKHDRWIDVGYWQRALADCAIPPPEPRRFVDVGLASGSDAPPPRPRSLAGGSDPA